MTMDNVRAAGVPRPSPLYSCAVLIHPAHCCVRGTAALRAYMVPGTDCHGTPPGTARTTLPAPVVVAPGSSRHSFCDVAQVFGVTGDTATWRPTPYIDRHG